MNLNLNPPQRDGRLRRQDAKYGGRVRDPLPFPNEPKPQVSPWSTGPPLDRYLPVELWHLILSYPDILTEDIRNLTLTSHFFHDIAQPLRFKSFSAGIIAFDDGTFYTDSFRRDKTDLRGRLEFVKSPTYVGTIRSVNIRVTTTKPYRLPKTNRINNISGETIIDTLFSSFSSLFNLRRLRLTTLVFTREQLSQISALPNLCKLHLDRCQLDQSVVEIPTMSLRKLSLDCCTQKPWWMPLLNPDTCTQLQLRSPDDCLAAFAAFKQDTREFAIEILRLDCDVVYSASRLDLVRMLSRMPGIKNVVLCYAATYEIPVSHLMRQVTVLSSGVFRLLTSITAPERLLGFFPRDSRLLVRCLVTTFKSSTTVSDISHGFPSLETLALLGPDNAWKSWSALRAPFSQLRKLKVLKLLYEKGVCNIEEVRPICEALRSYDLPPSLTELHVGFDMVNTKTLQNAQNLTGYVTEDIISLRAKLPNLTHLLVLSQYHYVEWQSEPCSLSCYTRNGRHGKVTTSW
ncbi:hypothetical protein QCA50_004166 [Cerrena zonata]|uniref:F-box domain-containing protein n=1 Tax=Cerrena zonata TaxID=2478898 RepID=A0AAW0GSL8_9APHY